MLKKIGIIFVVVIVLTILITSYSNNPRIIARRVIHHPPVSGELTYTLYFFGFLPAGKATIYPEMLEKQENAEVYHLHAKAQSLSIFSIFFKASGSVDSFLAKDTLDPFIFKQKITFSGKPDIEKEVYYDQKNGIMSIAGEKRDIPPHTRDPLSVIFNIRKTNLDAAKNIDENINTNQKNYSLKGSVRAESIQTGKGKYTIFTIKSEIKRREKSPYHKSKVEIVFLQLKNKENIPLGIRVFASGFTFTASLTKTQ